MTNSYLMSVFILYVAIAQNHRTLNYPKLWSRTSKIKRSQIKCYQDSEDSTHAWIWCTELHNSIKY